MSYRFENNNRPPGRKAIIVSKVDVCVCPWSPSTTMAAHRLLHSVPSPQPRACALNTRASQATSDVYMREFLETSLPSAVQLPRSIYSHFQCRTGGWGGGGLGVQTPPPKFRKPSKIVPNSTRLWKLLKIAEFRTPTPQDVRKKGSKILKLPRFATVLHYQWQINWLSS